MNPQIIDFSSPLRGEATTPAADRLIAGDPRQTVANYFADAIAAILRRPLVEFAAESGASDIPSPSSAASSAAASCSRIWRAIAGNSVPGPAFVVPAGFEGTWEVIEDCTKFYAIFEART